MSDLFHVKMVVFIIGFIAGYLAKYSIQVYQKRNKKQDSNTQ
jgi:hypothetical protein